MKPPQSCDTFVVLPPLAKSVIFGKNSDRPAGEIQEVVFFPECVYTEPTQLKCTYIEIEQASHTNAVILSKPAWMWGAEMGANSKGVCIGNEAIWPKTLDPDDAVKERLLGMDLVRLGLERGDSARHALDIITSLLEKYGQGGPCSDTDPSFAYFNSFLICDQEEAWVLETSDKEWAAEKVTDGRRNISNCLSIRKKIDLCSSDLKDKSKELGLWNGRDEFDFTEVFGTGYEDVGRFTAGKELLGKSNDIESFRLEDMFAILRDKESGICRPCSAPFASTGSQVSVLPPKGSSRPACHWFTGTPDPSQSVFKPFVFTTNCSLGKYTRSAVPDPDPVQVIPRFEFTVDRAHELHKAHEACLAKAPNILNSLRKIEAECVAEVEGFLDEVEKNPGKIDELDDLFKDCVETEIKLYRAPIASL